MNDAPQRAVVHVGTRMDGPGGIAGVMRSMRDSALGHEWRFVFVESIYSGAPLSTRLWQSATFPPRVLRALIGNPSAMMHVHMAQRGSFQRKRIAIRLARLLRRPVIVQIHSGVFVGWANSTSRRRKSVARVLESCSAVVVLGESRRERVLSIAPSARCVVIRNAVDPPSERSRGSVPPLVVFFGVLEYAKGVQDLLEAMRGIQEQGVDASWVLAGNGDVEGTRRQVATLPSPEMVHVPGFVWSPEKEDILGRADVFVLPSLTEGLPVSLLEAMSFGLACVVSPVGAIPEVVVDGENGVYCSPGNPESLGTVLLRVLTDAELRQALGGRARQTVIECCSMDAFVREWSSLYSAVAEQRGA